MCFKELYFKLTWAIVINFHLSVCSLFSSPKHEVWSELLWSHTVRHHLRWSSFKVVQIIQFHVELLFKLELSLKQHIFYSAYFLQTTGYNSVMTLLWIKLWCRSRCCLGGIYHLQWVICIYSENLKNLLVQKYWPDLKKKCHKYLVTWVTLYQECWNYFDPLISMTTRELDLYV